MANFLDATILIMKPKRIILLRHAESEGNIDKNIYKTKPDYALNITEKGIKQSKLAGEFLPSGNHNLQSEAFQPIPVRVV